jgi:hypothetical protein
MQDALAHRQTLAPVGSPARHRELSGLRLGEELVTRADAKGAGRTDPTLWLSGTPPDLASSADLRDAIALATRQPPAEVERASRILVVNEAQWPDTRAFEVIRELRDNEDTPLAVILGGAETRYQKLKNRQAPDSRILMLRCTGRSRRSGPVSLMLGHERLRRLPPAPPRRFQQASACDTRTGTA